MEVVSLMLQYREQCIATSGSDEGYRQVLQSIQSAKICVLNRIDMQQLQMDAVELANGARKPFYDKYCPILNESVSCFDDTFEGIAKCLGHDTDRVKGVLKTMAHNLLDLGCQKDGQLFDDIEKPEYQQCMALLKEEGVQQCTLSDSTKKMSIVKYGAQQCWELNDVSECLKKKIDTCNAPRLFDMFQVVLNAVSNANDCKQHAFVDESFSNNIDGTVAEDEQF